MNKEKKRKLIELVVLSAIVILLQLAGSAIRIGEFSISLILIPVVVGAVLCGPWAGGWLGFLFGAVLILTGETDAYWETSHIYTIIDTTLRGAAAGFASGVVYSYVRRTKEDFAIVLASVTAPVVNTGVFIILTPILFYDLLAPIFGEGHVFAGMIKNYVSINFLIELALNMVLTPALIRLAKSFDDSVPSKPDPIQKGRKMLAARLTSALILLGVIICIVSSVSGYNNYGKSTETIHSIVMMICVEVIFITLYSFYISYRVIEPIKMISSEVSGFVKSENKTGGNLSSINTHDEIQQLAEDIVKMEEDIGNYITDITEITAEKERIKTELNVAAKIQADMLPTNFDISGDRKDFDIFASMTPAKEVGGDFYDFFMIDDDHIALVIADVSDKGVPAALFMVIAKTLIKNQASFTSSPKDILEAVNHQLCNNNSSKMFVTVWLCIFEISTGHCVAANAGHEYPAIKGTSGTFELLKDQHGFVLGGVPVSVYSEYEFTMEKGDSIFVYTDGVTEAANAEEELFGTDRLLSALNVNSAALPQDIITNVKSAIDAFVRDAPQFDDITMLCIKRN